MQRNVFLGDDLAEVPTIIKSSNLFCLTLTWIEQLQITSMVRYLTFSKIHTVYIHSAQPYSFTGGWSTNRGSWLLCVLLVFSGLRSPFPGKKPAQRLFKMGRAGLQQRPLDLKLQRPEWRWRRGLAESPELWRWTSCINTVLSPSGLPGFCLMGVTERGGNRVVTRDLC